MGVPMRHWWSLARGEVDMLAVMAGAGIGVAVASARGLDQVGVWAAFAVGALLFGVPRWVIGRGHDESLPEVSFGMMLLVSVPVLAAWWLVLAPLVGVSASGPLPAYLVWFMSGILLARILARILTAYRARNSAPT
jgi:hypothetical protein